MALGPKRQDAPSSREAYGSTKWLSPPLRVSRSQRHTATQDPRTVDTTSASAVTMSRPDRVDARRPVSVRARAGVRHESANLGRPAASVRHQRARADESERIDAEARAVPASAARRFRRSWLIGWRRPDFCGRSLKSVIT